jgi:hypothetical protein
MKESNPPRGKVQTVIENTSTDFFDPEAFRDPSKSNIHGLERTPEPNLHEWRDAGRKYGIPIADA